MSAPADRRGAPGRRALSLLLAGLVVMACCLLVLWAREQAHQPSAWSGVYATEDARIALLVRPDGRVTVVLPEGSEQGVEAVEDAEALRVGGSFPGKLISESSISSAGRKSPMWTCQTRKRWS